MWSKSNLPMFLFNVGLLTLIKIDSIIFLAMQLLKQKGLEKSSEKQKKIFRQELNLSIVS